MSNVELTVRTAFISDVHLGAVECQAEELLDLLAHMHCETLVLAGDIVDFCSLRRRVHWPPSHQAVARAILTRARSGTRVIFVPGNHDAELRDLDGARYANVEIRREYVHRTAAGLKLLITHGDELDAIVHCSAWLAWLGDQIYSVVLRINRIFNRVRRLSGLRYWPLAAWLKQRVANAMRYVEQFELAATHLARARGMDGIVCGHIHRARLARHGGTVYCNSGDWVENCSFAFGRMNGELGVCIWPASAGAAAVDPVPASGGLQEGLDAAA